MAILRESDLTGFLKRKTASSNGLLLYGNDGSAIASALREVVASMSGGEEPLRMDVGSLKSDPAALDDAFRAMSLLGDRRLVIVSGADENHFTHVRSVLEARGSGNFIVLVADSLKKGSKLRAAAEANPLFHAVAFYEETGGAVIQRLEAVMRTKGMKFAEGAAERFVDLAGTERSVLLGEAEKLSLYCHPATLISVEDVEAACGDQAAFEADTLISAVMDGELERADRMFASMVQSGDAKSVLIMLQMHLARLEHVSAALARGIDIDTAARGARPPFFGPQVAAAGRWLRALSGDDLGRMQVAVQTAILQSRQMAELSDAITGRLLLSLARMARQSRARAA